MENNIVRLNDSVVSLVPLDEQLHLENCIVWMNDPEIQQYILAFLPITRTEEKQWFEKRHEDKSNLTWAIHVLEGGQSIHVGNIGLNRIEYKRNRTAESGMLIGNKQYWNKRIGTRAKMILLNYAFNIIGLHKVESSVISYNERSARCLLRCGYKQEGLRRRCIFRNGTWWDRLEFGIFREEFTEAYVQLKERGEVD